MHNFKNASESVPENQESNWRCLIIPANGTPYVIKKMSIGKTYMWISAAPDVKHYCEDIMIWTFTAIPSFVAKSQ
jgi:hypothetical protein